MWLCNKKAAIFCHGISVAKLLTYRLKTQITKQMQILKCKKRHSQLTDQIKETSFQNKEYLSYPTNKTI